MKTLTLAATALASLFLFSAAPIAAHADAGDRIDRRLDRRAHIAEENGHPLRAERLDRKGDRIDRRLDRRGHRIERRLDRRGH